MSDGEQSLEAFSIKSIGPEPNGATPIEEEDLNGLIPDFVATRADLNRVEYDNISKALPWVSNKRELSDRTEYSNTVS